MRIGTSRADRIGFAVVVVLASLLAVLLFRGLGNESTDSAQEVATFADVAPPTAVPQTEAVSMPAPTATPTPDPTPLPVEPAAAPEADEDDEVDTEEEADEASTADSSGDDDGTTATASAGTTGTANAAPAPATESSDSGSVPNPQPPAATAVPNPQPPAATAVPNPQPSESAVPNPQPATQPIAAVGNVPADAPAGGTFTHTLTAKVNGVIPLFRSPGGEQFMPTFNGTALPAQNPTVFGNPLAYRVLAGAPGDGWAKVYVPARPNGTVAWVQTAQFNWGSSNRMLQINVANNTVTVFEGSNVLLTTSAVTGKSTSRTPLAQGWVEEIMAGPSSAFGPRLISLGIFSNDLNSFSGGIPKVALHGTNNPGLMGQYASNGCIRVRNEIINQIAGMMPIGSKVVIVG